LKSAEMALELPAGLFHLGQARPLTRFTRGLILNPEISPDGRRIAYYRGATESDIVLVKPRD